MNLRDFVPFDKWIKKEYLIMGGTYFCKARNFEYGVWNGNVKTLKLIEKDKNERCR